MRNKETLATPSELAIFAQDHGHSIRPLFERNDDRTIQSPKIIGYILASPNGNKTTLYRNRLGMLSLSSARAWCNSVNFIAEVNKRCVMASANV